MKKLFPNFFGFFAFFLCCVVRKSQKIYVLAEKNGETVFFWGVPKSGKMPKIQIFVFLYNVFLNILSAIKVRYDKFRIVLGYVKHLQSCKTIISSA